MADQNLLIKRGVRFVVTSQKKTFLSLKQQSWLTPIWTEGVQEKNEETFLSVFEVKSKGRRFGFNPSLSSHLKEVQFVPPGHYRISFSSPVTIEQGAVLAVSYHPWLKVVMNGNVIATKPDIDSLLELTSEVKNVSTIDIIYSPPLMAKLSKIISCLGVFGLFLC